MAEQIIARLLNQKESVLQWLMLDNAIAKEMQQGTLQDLAQSAGDNLVTLLYPASEILLLGIELPVKSNSQIKKALPFALEDLLADDVETYHSVWHRQPKDKVYVALVNHDKFKTCLESFQHAGIKIDSVYPETLCLPYLPDTCSIFLDDQQAVLRSGKGLGGGMDREMLPIMLDKIRLENPHLHALQVWSVEESPQDLSDLPVDINYHKVDSLLSLLVSGVATVDTHYNLLTGSFERKQSLGWQWKKWLPAMGVIIFATLLQTGFLVNRYWQQQAELSAVESQTLSLFKQTFPEVKRLVNIKVQADQALIDLRKNSASQGSLFMSLLYQTGIVLNANPGYKLQQLDFINDLLQIQLTVPDSNQLEQLKQQLEGSHQLLVKVQSAEAAKNGMEVHFEIKQK
jgi:general secretion pathway protein L